MSGLVHSVHVMCCMLWPSIYFKHIYCKWLLLSFSSLRFKNVMFDISPTEEVGDFEVKAKFMGVEMEKVPLHFQVNIQHVQNFTK